MLTKWAETCQNQQNDCASSKDSDQPRYPPSLIRVFAVRMRKSWVLSYPRNALRRLWSDCAHAQADLSLRRAHTHFVGFVMSWLKYTCNFNLWMLKIVFMYLKGVYVPMRSTLISWYDTSHLNHSDNIEYSKSDIVLLKQKREQMILTNTECNIGLGPAVQSKLSCKLIGC